MIYYFMVFIKLKHQTKPVATELERVLLYKRKVQREKVDPILGPAYDRRVSERAVAGTLRFTVEKTPLLLPRLLSLSPCRSSGPGLICRRHLGE